MEELAILNETTAALSSPLTDVRRRALLNHSAWPGELSAYEDVILKCLDDLAWSVREAALMPASRLYSPRLDARLLAMTLHDPQPLVRNAAASVLGPRIEIVRDFHSALVHRHERQRTRALTAIRHAPLGQAAVLLQYVRAGLRDSHVKVRRAALTTASVLPLDVLQELVVLITRRANERDKTNALLANTLLTKLSHELL